MEHADLHGHLISRQRSIRCYRQTTGHSTNRRFSWSCGSGSFSAGRGRSDVAWIPNRLKRRVDFGAKSLSSYYRGGGTFF